MSDTEYIKSLMLKKREDSMFKNQGFLSSGSTLLNLACTGTVEGAWPIGGYSLFVGDSNSGKTYVGLGTLAEASIDSRFDGYDLIFDCGEYGCLMDIEKHFGQALDERMEAPRYDGDDPLVSTTVEELYVNIDYRLNKGKPFIWVVDSMDCLSSLAETATFEKLKKMVETNKATAGSYGDGKAKLNSANLRRLMTPLQEMGSVLLILNQTRDSFDMFKPKNRSGGRALGFYAQVEVWSAIKKKLKKTVREKDRQYGILSNMKVTRSRVTGLEREVLVPIISSCGIDDIGSSIDYLISEKVWKKKRQKIDTDGFCVDDLTRSKLIHVVEEDGLEDDLEKLVEETWNEIEETIKVVRKSRYETKLKKKKKRVVKKKVKKEEEE